jgi:CRP/FNR family transcriptional regulator, cyclic AMP receptor protein
MSAPTELLKRVPIFSDLGDNEIERISRSFRDRTFSAGQEVVTEGRGGVGFFVIESGEAAVSVHGEERRTMGAGDYFGEVALIDEGPRTATITAKTDLKCWGLTPWDFRPLVETNAAIAWQLLQTFARRLREAEARG